MMFNVVTTEGTFPRLEMSKQKGFFVDGKILNGVQEIQIKSPLGQATELLIRMIVDNNLPTHGNV